MNKRELFKIAYNLLGDKYYDEFHPLKNDIEFFRMYMGRERKSNFRFDVRINSLSHISSFNDIWRTYCYDIDCIEEVYGTFLILKSIILDINNDTQQVDEITRKRFLKYFKTIVELNPEEYITEFVGCSLKCEAIRNKIIEYLE